MNYKKFFPWDISGTRNNFKKYKGKKKGKNNPKKKEKIIQKK
jgi:hypothetical protein